MDILFPGSTDDEIMVKVALRAACLLKAARVEANDQNKQYAAHVSAWMAKPEVAAVLADPAYNDIRAEITERLSRLIQDKFVYVQPAAVATEAAALRARGYALIPADINTQRLGPDTCKCKLHQAVKFTADDTNPVQSFGISGCEHHDASVLTVAELHDKVHAENRLKNRFEGSIRENVPAAVEAKHQYRWAFDADRLLVVDVSGLPAQAANGIRGLTARLEFKGKVRVDG